MDPQVLVLALAGAASVFVVWVAVATSWRKRSERQRVAQSLSEQAPDPTPEEILEAQALGLIPPGQPTPPSSAS